MILKFTWKCKGTRIAKTILKDKNKVRAVILLNFKTSYRHSNQEWNLHKDKYVNKQGRIQSS